MKARLAGLFVMVVVAVGFFVASGQSARAVPFFAGLLGGAERAGNPTTANNSRTSGADAQSSRGSGISHDYFEYQTDNRTACSGSSGTNCIVQIPACASTVPDDNGACSLRNDAQLEALTNKPPRSRRGWFYAYGADSFQTPQDGAKLWIDTRETDTDGPNQMSLNFAPTTHGGSLTVVWETWWDPAWRQTECGGGLGNTQINIKAWRLDFLPADRSFGSPWTIAANPKHAFNYANNQTLYPCSDNVIGVHTGGLVGNMANLVSYGLVTPAQIGQTGGDTDAQPSGRGGYFLARAAGGGYQGYPLIAGRWTRYILHIEFDVRGNSSKFADWRADCDSAGVNTAKDQVCARMLATLATKDADCAVENAANCDSTWMRSSWWSCDEVRGCQRVFYGVPWHNFALGVGMNKWRIEYDSSQNTCTDCTSPRVIYERNNFIIRNINPSDIDDTGCPNACPGDRGVSSNLFKKPGR